MTESAAAGEHRADQLVRQPRRLGRPDGRRRREAEDRLVSRSASGTWPARWSSRPSIIFSLGIGGRPARAPAPREAEGRRGGPAGRDPGRPGPDRAGVSGAGRGPRRFPREIRGRQKGQARCASQSPFRCRRHHAGFGRCASRLKSAVRVGGASSSPCGPAWRGTAGYPRDRTDRAGASGASGVTPSRTCRCRSRPCRRCRPSGSGRTSSAGRSRGRRRCARRRGR